MLFDVRCKEGKLQVGEDAMMRITSFNRLIWQAPCQAITGFTTQPGPMKTVALTIHTTIGTHTTEMVTEQNFAKLQALFPHLMSQTVGKEWYHHPASLTQSLPTRMSA